MTTSKLILGTVQLGKRYGIRNITGKPDRKEAFAILSEAYAGGIRVLDTADNYGDSQGIIGSFHLSHPHFLVGNKFSLGGRSTAVTKILDNCLKLLNVSHLDYLSYHNFRDFVEHPELKEELRLLQQRGDISSIGISVYTKDEFEAAIQSDFIQVIQFPFNVFDNAARKGQLMARAKERKKILHARSVFLQGLLLLSPDELPASLVQFREPLTAMHRIAGDLGISIQSLGLNYALSNPLIDNVLIGVERRDQLTENLRCVSESMGQDAIAEIESINPPREDYLNPSKWCL